MAIIRVNSQRASELAHYAVPAFSEICAANSEIAVFVLGCVFATCRSESYESRNSRFGGARLRRFSVFRVIDQDL